MDLTTFSTDVTC